MQRHPSAIARRRALATISVLWAATLLPLLACAGESTPSIAEAPDLGEIRAGIETAFDAYRDHLQNGSEDALTFYCEGDLRWFEEGRLAYTSRADIARGLEQAASFGTVRFDFRDLFVTPTSSKQAWWSAAFTNAFGDPEQGGFQFSGVMTGLMERTDTSWCVRAGHTSSTPPASADERRRGYSAAPSSTRRAPPAPDRPRAQRADEATRSEAALGAVCE